MFVWLMLKMGTSVFHCSCSTHQDLSKQFCLLIPAINKIIVLKKAFWQFKHSLEKAMRGLDGLLQRRKSNFLHIKKQQAQPNNSYDSGEGLYFVVYPCMANYWNFTEDFQRSWKSLQNSYSFLNSPLGVLSPAFLKTPGWPVNWLGWCYRLVEH